MEATQQQPSPHLDLLATDVRLVATEFFHTNRGQTTGVINSGKLVTDLARRFNEHAEDVRALDMSAAEQALVAADLGKEETERRLGALRLLKRIATPDGRIKPRITEWDVRDRVRRTGGSIRLDDGEVAGVLARRDELAVSVGAVALGMSPGPVPERHAPAPITLPPKQAANAATPTPLAPEAQVEGPVPDTMTLADHVAGFLSNNVDREVPAAELEELLAMYLPGQPEADIKKTLRNVLTYMQAAIEEHGNGLALFVHRNPYRLGNSFVLPMVLSRARQAAENPDS
jgi:hypothetical protein